MLALPIAAFATVSASVQQIADRDGGADDTYAALMSTRTGASISMQHCSASRGDGVNVCKVVGTEGTLVLDAGSARPYPGPRWSAWSRTPASDNGFGRDPSLAYRLASSYRS